MHWSKITDKGPSRTSRQRASVRKTLASMWKRIRRRQARHDSLGSLTMHGSPLPTFVDHRCRPRGLDQVSRVWLDRVVKRYAPVVWFHRGETMFPTSVDEFLAHCPPNIIDGRTAPPGEGVAAAMGECCPHQSAVLPPVYVLVWPGRYEVREGTSLVVQPAPRQAGNKPNPYCDPLWTTTGDYVLAYHMFFPLSHHPDGTPVVGDMHCVQLHMRNHWPYMVVTLDPATSKGTVWKWSAHHRPVIYSASHRHSMDMDPHQRVGVGWDTSLSEHVVLEPHAWARPGDREWWVEEIRRMGERCDIMDNAPFSCFLLLHK
jgi:hypothetical protein